MGHLLKQKQIGYLQDFYDWYLKYYYKRMVYPIGSLTYDKNIVKGFSTSNYLRLLSPFAPGLDSLPSWEMQFKVKTGSNLTTEQYVYNTIPHHGVAFSLYNSKFTLWLSSNGTSWNITSANACSEVITANTWYWLKLKFDGSSYKVYISTTGTYSSTPSKTITSSAFLYPTISQSLFAVMRSADAVFSFPWLGEIDLSEYYIKIGDEIWWQGIQKNSTMIEPNVNITGYPHTNLIALFSGFSKNDYISLPNIFPISGMQNFEIRLRFYYVPSSDLQLLFDCGSTSTAVSFRIFLYNSTTNKIVYCLTSNGTSWIANNIQGSNTLVANQWYDLIFTWDGSTYTGKISTDGQNWINDFSIASTLPPYTNAAYSRIGSFGYGTEAHPVISTIDLLGCYININGQRWWTGTKEGTGNWSIYEIASNNTRTYSGEYTSKILIDQKSGTEQDYDSQSLISNTSSIKRKITGYFQNFYNWYLKKYLYKNVTVVGSPTINKNIVSGFSTSNYLKAPFTIPNNTTTFKVKFRTPTTTPTAIQTILIKETGVGIELGKDMKIYSYSWNDKNIYSNYTLALNTAYCIDVVCSWKGTKIYSLYNADRSTLLETWTVSDSTFNLSNTQPICLGFHNTVSGGRIFAGQIDLSGCSITDSSGNTWSGILESTKGSPNVSIVGNPTILDNFVVSGFSTSNYLTTPKTINLNTVNSFEICLKCTYEDGSLIQIHSNAPYVIAMNPNMFLIRLVGGSGWTTVYPTTTTGMVIGKIYWVKGIFTGSQYIFQRSEDGVNYTTLGTLNSSVKPISNTQNFVIGINDVHTDPYLGTIDLSGCYININGQRWWDGISTSSAHWSNQDLESNNTREYDGEYTNRILIDQKPGTEDDYDEKASINKGFPIYRKAQGYFQNFYDWYLKYYYKRNITVVGSPTFNKNIVSGFSSSSYLNTRYAFSPGSSTWEMTCEFTPNSSVTTAQGIFGGIGSSDGATPFYMENGNWVAYLSSNGTSWNLAKSTTVMALAANTTYYCKAEFTGTSYIFSLWENGSWVVKKTITSSSTIYGGLTQELGNNRGQGNPFLGSINLEKCQIKIGDQIVWKGILDSTKGFPNITYAGNLIVEDNSILSNFSSSNYGIISRIPSNVTSFEIVFKANTPDLNTRNTIIGNDATNIHCPRICLDGGNWDFALPSSSYAWQAVVVPNTIVSANQDFWVKMLWSSSSAKMEAFVSLDGSSWTKVGEVNASTIGWNEYIRIGNDNNVYPWLGSINLSKCYININGSRWWSGITASTADWSDQSLESNNTRTYSGQYTNRILIDQKPGTENDDDEIKTVVI